MSSLPSFMQPAMALLLSKICLKAIEHPNLNPNLPMANQFSDSELTDIIKEYDPTFAEEDIPELIVKVRTALGEMEALMFASLK